MTITPPAQVSMEEAIIIPTIAVATTTADKLVELMERLQKEKEEAIRLINELKAESALLEGEEKATNTSIREQSEEVREQNDKINLLVIKITALQEKSQNLETLLRKERDLLCQRQGRTHYLNSDLGIHERWERGCARINAERVAMLQKLGWKKNDEFDE